MKIKPFHITICVVFAMVRIPARGVANLRYCPLHPPCIHYKSLHNIIYKSPSSLQASGCQKYISFVRLRVVNYDMNRIHIYNYDYIYWDPNECHSYPMHKFTQADHPNEEKELWKRQNLGCVLVKCITIAGKCIALG